MRIRTTTTIILAAAIALGVTGCASSTPAKPAAAPVPAASSAAPAAPATSSVPAAPTPAASPASSPAVESAGSLPPKPDAATTAKYIAALIAINPEIVNGKDDKAVNRGRDECTSIAAWPTDREKLLDLANKRFISPNHPEGFGLATAARILDVVHTHICPKY
jgi:hypothetical protein